MSKLRLDRRFFALAAVAAIAAASTAAIGEVAQHRAHERLRTVRGSFDLFGNVIGGAGFTVTSETNFLDPENPGSSDTVTSYEIKFDRPFAGRPTIQASGTEILSYDNENGSGSDFDGIAVYFTSITRTAAKTDVIYASAAFDRTREISFIAVGP